MKARDWFKDKKYPSTWGNEFMNKIPAESKNKRGRPTKKSANKK